ncbi:MAG: DUF503 domain-containing protein [Planctomycetes bacterium]|nr:DUF503 domain-containing protein [Planctomycetota bacterium]
MVLGVLQFQVLIHGAESLKDKRRVIQSLKDRLHREHMVSVAEVGDPDMLNFGVLALAVVARDGQRVAEVLDAVTLKLRELRDGEIGEIDRQVLHASAGWLGGLRDETESETPRVLDPKSGDGSDAETDALIHERALEADVIEQIEQAEREARRQLGGDAA